MYTSFYNLSEMPFTISTDPRFLWLGEKHQEALANLRYGLLEANGYVVLTGDVGTGKTTLVNALIESLDDNVLAANINHPTLSTLEFFKFMAGIYGAPTDFSGKTDFLITFTQFLEKSYSEGKIVLLIIDESHRLSEDLLEEIRLLSNIEHKGIKLINIFFVGQNELKEVLLAPRFRALRQRITLFYDIAPLTAEETADYIAHRLQVAGGNRNLFTREAIHRIHDFTHGYPRLINILCGRAMLTGYVQDQKSIESSIVAECIEEIRFLDPVQTVAQPDYRKPQPATIEQINRSSRSPQREKESEPVAVAERPGPVKRQVKKEKRNVEETTTTPGKKNRRIMQVLGLAALLAFIVFAQVTDNVPKSTEKEEIAVPADRGDGDRQEVRVDPAKIPAEVDQSAEEQAGTEKKGTAGQDKTEQQEKKEELGEETSPLPVKSEQKKSEQIVAQQEKQKQEGKKQVQDESTGQKDKSIPPESEPPQSAAKPVMKSEEKIASAKTPPATPVNLPQPSALELATAAAAKGNFQIAIDILQANYNLETEGDLDVRQLYAKALNGLAEQVVARSPDKAESLLRKAVEQDPQNSESYFSLGKIYTKSKEYAKAIEAYSKAASLNPSFADALFNLGFLYATTGMYEDAEQLFARVVQLKPRYLDKALFNLAVIQERLGKREASLANLQKAVVLRPDNKKLQNYLKEILKERGGKSQ